MYCVLRVSLGYFKRQHGCIPSRLKCYSLKSPSQLCIHHRATARKTALCGAAQQLHVVWDGRLSQVPGLFSVGAMLVCCSNSYNAGSSQITHIFNQVIHCFSLFLKETRKRKLKAFIKHNICQAHFFLESEEEEL